MQIIASKRNLREHAKSLLGNNWSPEREAELINVALNGFEAGPRGHHASHAEAEHLEKLDTILGNHGVEGFSENGRDVQYSNTGDTYTMTLMYVNGGLFIGDWGSVVEESSNE